MQKKTKLPWEGVKDPTNRLIVLRGDVAEARRRLGPPTNASAMPAEGVHKFAVHVDLDSHTWEYEGLDCPANCNTCRSDSVWADTLPRVWPKSQEVAGYVFQVYGGKLQAGCQTVPLDVVRAGVAASDRMLRRSKADREATTLQVKSAGRDVAAVKVRADGSLMWLSYGVSRTEVLRIKRHLA